MGSWPVSTFTTGQRTNKQNLEMGSNVSLDLPNKYLTDTWFNQHHKYSKSCALTFTFFFKYIFFILIAFYNNIYLGNFRFLGIKLQVNCHSLCILICLVKQFGYMLLA